MTKVEFQLKQNELNLNHNTELNRIIKTETKTESKSIMNAGILSQTYTRIQDHCQHIDNALKLSVYRSVHTTFDLKPFDETTNKTELIDDN